MNALPIEDAGMNQTGAPNEELKYSGLSL